MSQLPEPDIVKITEVFLVPSSFIVAALGTADTNLHRAGVSLIGLVVSALWWACSHEALAERATSSEGLSSISRRMRILSWLPIVFATSWTVSLVAHLMLMGYPLGK